jgi:hypothetical protein
MVSNYEEKWPKIRPKNNGQNFWPKIRPKNIDLELLKLMVRNYENIGPKLGRKIMARIFGPILGRKILT